MYLKRFVDKYLSEWASRSSHKPVLLRGARQVGKSTAVRHLSEQFKSYVEINFEKQSEYKVLFEENLDVARIIAQMSAMCGKSIKAGETLLFLDEIQQCPRAIMSLRFFKEDMPNLHVIAAGSLLEFAMEELPTFGVGRIHSIFMHPMTFDEFLEATGNVLLLEVRNQASPYKPLASPIHDKLVSLLRVYMLVGGMPEVVRKWTETHDFLQCQEIQDDILISFEDDFPKYKKRVEPLLLRLTMRSAALQLGKKFVYSQVSGSHKTNEIRTSLEMLIQAGLLIPVTHTAANGLPLGSEADISYRKILVLDPGLLLRLHNMTTGDITGITTHILTASASELVNKGSMAELLAGLEMFRYKSPNLRNELFYWVRQAKNSLAEIDYVTSHDLTVLPIEVKSGTQGGMKSLWSFMREKHITNGIRCSLENFGCFDYVDKSGDGAVRHVSICPLYAISMMNSVCNSSK